MGPVEKEKVMIKPKEGQILPENDHSRTKVLFVCDCGNEKLISWKNYKTNHTKSCGSCKRLKLENIINKKFGKLIWCVLQLHAFWAQRMIRFVPACKFLISRGVNYGHLVPAPSAVHALRSRQPLL